MDSRRLGGGGGGGGSSGHGSESEGLYDTGDEDIMEAVLRTAAASAERRAPRDRPRKSSCGKDADRKSCELLLAGMFSLEARPPPRGLSRP